MHINALCIIIAYLLHYCYCHKVPVTVLADEGAKHIAVINTMNTMIIEKNLDSYQDTNKLDVLL